MAKTYLELQQQIATLTAQAEKAKQSEIAAVVARIKEAIATYGITASDLGLAKAPSTKRSAKAGAVRQGARAAVVKAGAAKFRDGNGNAWGGRGPRPRWLRDAIAAGATLESFAA